MINKPIIRSIYYKIETDDNNISQTYTMDILNCNFDGTINTNLNISRARGGCIYIDTSKKTISSETSTKGKINVNLSKNTKINNYTVPKLSHRVHDH